MKIVVNGETIALAKETTLRLLLDELAYQAGTLAVAVNETFVPRSSYETTVIRSGDRVEIVAPMQGG